MCYLKTARQNFSGEAIQLFVSANYINKTICSAGKEHRRFRRLIKRLCFKSYNLIIMLMKD